MEFKTKTLVKTQLLYNSDCRHIKHKKKHHQNIIITISNIIIIFKNQDVRVTLIQSYLL